MGGSGRIPDGELKADGRQTGKEMGPGLDDERNTACSYRCFTAGGEHRAHRSVGFDDSRAPRDRHCRTGWQHHPKKGTSGIKHGVAATLNVREPGRRAIGECKLCGAGVHLCASAAFDDSNLFEHSRRLIATRKRQREFHVLRASQEAHLRVDQRPANGAVAPPLEYLGLERQRRSITR